MDCSGDRAEERARGPVDCAPTLESPSEGGSPRAGGVGNRRACGPRANQFFIFFVSGACPSLASGGASPDRKSGAGPARAETAGDR